MKQFLLLLGLLVAPASAYANEIRLSCTGELDYSAIRGNEAGVELVTEIFQEQGITNSGHEIVINKVSKVAIITESDQNAELHSKVPFFETPTEYLIEIKDKSNPDYDQRKQHQIDRTDGSYTYIWEVKIPENGGLLWQTPFFGKCIKQRKVKTLF